LRDGDLTSIKIQDVKYSPLESANIKEKEDRE
jgi:hypothetical protein